NEPESSVQKNQVKEVPESEVVSIALTDQIVCGLEGDCPVHELPPPPPRRRTRVGRADAGGCHHPRPLLLPVGLRLRRQVPGREGGVLLELLRPDRRQLARLLGLLPGEVLRFRSVRAEVVQLPRALLAGGDDLPVAGAQRAVALVEPPEG